MSAKWMFRAFEERVGNPSRKLVLLKLADNANDNGECWPSYQHIADQCDMSRRSAIDHIKALEKLGMLSISHRKGVKGNTSNIYRLCFGGVEKPAPRKTNEFAGGANSSLPPSANSSLPPSANSAPASADSAPPPSAESAPRTYHSSEPTNEPLKDIGTTSVEPPQKIAPYPDEFEWIWENRPRREGSDNKKKAYQHCKARLKGGATWRELAEGCNRYHEYCKTKGNLNTEYVMQMTTFFGTGEHYKNEWMVNHGTAATDQLTSTRQQGKLSTVDRQHAAADAYLAGLQGKHRSESSDDSVVVTYE